MKRTLALLGIGATLVAIGCVIGPKQEDPASLREPDAGPPASDDAGAVFGDGGFTGGDTSPVDHADTGAHEDASTDAAPDDSPDAPDALDASDAPDAAEDAIVTDGDTEAG